MLENDRVGGPRTYTGPETHVASIWKCVACGEQNDGPLVDGCVHCGSGRPGVHKGVDPVVTPEERARILAAQNAMANQAQKNPALRRVPDPVIGDVQSAFMAWITHAGADVGPLAAFTAGWNAAQSIVGLTPPATAHSPSVSSAAISEETTPTSDDTTEPSPFPPQQIKERTLLAALRFFRTQILPEAGEEVATGEWLAVADVDAWIVELEKELAQ